MNKICTALRLLRGFDKFYGDYFGDLNSRIHSFVAIQNPWGVAVQNFQ
jgi:hypothetical protein